MSNDAHTASAEQPPAVAIADRIEALRAYYVAAAFGFVLLMDSDALNLMQAKGYDPGSTMRLGRLDGTQHEDLPDIWSAVALVRGNRDFNIGYLGVWWMVIISLVGDDLARNEYFDRSPELEFLRHLRNAISHGNRWHFVGNEPRRPAAFRQFVLSPALHGSDALFQFMAPGDVADLLLDVGAHLRAYGAAK